MSQLGLSLTDEHGNVCTMYVNSLRIYISNSFSNSSDITDAPS